MKNPLVKYCLLFITIALILADPSVAYRDEAGAEVGDVVDVDYELSFTNGTVKEANPFSGVILRSTANGGNTIDGFYQGILGMKIGETKIVTVPPELGYTTPGHDLYGLTLIFEITLLRVVQNIRTDYSQTSTPGGGGADDGDGAFSKVWGVVKVFLYIGGGIFFIFAFYTILQKQTIPGCAHCKSLGKSNVSEGKCGKCGTPYCRNSFSRGCPNCKSNTFIPYS
ncbi:MAG: FKBP-type peptidyl-prolyl cis-trans isomerase [Candidatus Kariarchaeaceae archaeon]